MGESPGLRPREPAMSRFAIEPGGHGRPSRPWRASSAFPTLTGPVALAARLRGPGGPFWGRLRKRTTKHGKQTGIALKL